MCKIAILIPCYNEELRLDLQSVDTLIDHSDLQIYFVNDGSTDKTVEVISKIIAQYPTRCTLLDYSKNSGKANAVYTAINAINNQNSYDYIGYFDADFSTPATEIIRLKEEVKQLQPSLLIGSRILLLNSGIKRKFYRHIIGRVIVTLINFKFKLGIYDTQCGAKFFSSKIISEGFDTPFNTSWLFDVELFIRLKKKGLLEHGREVPIFNWRDVEGSKLTWKSVFKIVRELTLLFRKY
ncbi:glycosyltransferase [Flavobacterium stagni]|uniref:Glycosyltransferase n=1 Tax=Flavobacterium stagni TaxID=2506421 RepID=A0A4Q1KF36_9FLAO|nr:glycosyltransferase [Flavobacterium stagni]RXR24348.1 glycosyltransferase [Flavobacterium stagni]